MKLTDKRWEVIIAYITERISDVHYVDEIEDIMQIVENGPDWNEIAHITINLHRRSWPTGSPLD